MITIRTKSLQSYEVSAEVHPSDMCSELPDITLRFRDSLRNEEFEIEIHGGSLLGREGDSLFKAFGEAEKMVKKFIEEHLKTAERIKERVGGMIGFDE